MFEKYGRLSDIRRAMFLMDEIPGAEDGTPPGGNGAASADGDVTLPEVDVTPPELVIPDGKILVDASESELLKWYGQFGSPEDLYNQMVDYTKMRNVPVAPADPPKEGSREAEIGKVQELMYEAFPFLKEVPGFMEKAHASSSNFADAAAGEVVKFGGLDEIPLKSKQDKEELVQLVTTTIEHNPQLLSRFRSKDISCVKEAYDAVAKRFYNVSNEIAPVPGSKLGTKAIVKGQSPGKVVKDEPAKDFEEAGAKGFERLQQLIKEEL